MRALPSGDRAVPVVLDHEGADLAAVRGVNLRLRLRRWSDGLELREGSHAANRSPATANRHQPRFRVRAETEDEAS